MCTKIGRPQRHVMVSASSIVNLYSSAPPSVSELYALGELFGPPNFKMKEDPGTVVFFSLKSGHKRN